MRNLLAAFVVLIGSIGPAAAYDTPTELIEALYAPYFKGFDFDWGGWEPETFRSTELNALFAKDAAETPEGMVGRIDFDPYINAQDYSITGFNIEEPKIDGDTATAEVLFVNFDLPQHMTFSMIREADGWKVDDVQSHDVNYPYKLRELLTAPY